MRNVLVLLLLLWTLAPWMAGADAGLREVRTATEDGYRIDYVDENDVICMNGEKGYASQVCVVEDGNPVEMYFFDEQGEPAKISGYHGRHNLYQDGKLVQITYVNAKHEAVKNASGYAMVKQTVDDAGHVVQEMFYDEKGQQIALYAGQYGLRRFAFDEKNRVTGYEYLDKFGNPMLLDTGYSSCIRTYEDETGSRVSMYFDLEGNPAVLYMGYSGIRESWTDGRLSSTTYLDANGQPMMNSAGYATVRYAYDEWGNRCRETYFDLSDRPVSLGRGRYGRAMEYDGKKLVRTYDIDANGRKLFLLEEFLGQNPLFNVIMAVLLVMASICLPKAACRALTFLYLLFILYMTLLTRESGEIQLNLNLFWSYRQFFVSASLRREIINNILLFIPLGALLYARMPSPWSLVICVLFSGMIEGTQLIFRLGLCELDDLISNGMGAAIGYAAVWLARRWAKRRVGPKMALWVLAGLMTVFAAKSEASGMPCAPDAVASGVLSKAKITLASQDTDASSAEYARLEKTYDAAGHVIEEMYFDEAGRAAVTSKGYAGIQRVYDEKGQMRQKTYVDASGNPTVITDGYATQTKAYDALGNAIEEWCLDEHGNRTVLPKGYAGIQRVYNEKKQMLAQTYVDKDGKPVEITGGYAAETRAYDARGNVVEAWYFDETGRKTVLPKGYTGIRREYDERKQMLCQTHVDADGKPVMIRDGYAAQTKAYDALGNVIEERYLDEAGTATTLPKGYAGIRRVYDDRKQMLAQTYVDADGKPVVIKDGYAMMTRAYDARGNAVEERYFDETGTATTLPKGYAGIERVYDEKKQMLSQTYVDADGKPVVTKDGYAMVTKAYDERGNAVEEWYFDETGQKTVLPKGYAGILRLYDGRKRMIRQTHVDADGKPVVTKQGYATQTKAYDVLGCVIEEWYFDEAGEATRLPKGYAGIRRTYNGRKQMISQTFLDEFGELAACKDGYASLKRTYDERGRVAAEERLDAEGRPCN